MNFAQSDETHTLDAKAFELGERNGARGRLVYDDLRYNGHQPDSVEKALCVAGFEAARIAKGIGFYPVLVHQGQRAFWMVAKGVYQANMRENSAPTGTAGYSNLRALFKLKNEAEA